MMEAFENICGGCGDTVDKIPRSWTKDKFGWLCGSCTKEEKSKKKDSANEGATLGSGERGKK